MKTAYPNNNKLEGRLIFIYQCIFLHEEQFFTDILHKLIKLNKT